MQIDFHSSEGSSLGIEMELEIVDIDTRELHSGATEILADVTGGKPAGWFSLPRQGDPAASARRVCSNSANLFRRSGRSSATGGFSSNKSL